MPTITGGRHAIDSNAALTVAERDLVSARAEALRATMTVVLGELRLLAEIAPCGAVPRARIDQTIGYGAMLPRHLEAVLEIVRWPPVATPATVLRVEDLLVPTGRSTTASPRGDGHDPAGEAGVGHEVVGDEHRLRWLLAVMAHGENAGDGTVGGTGDDTVAIGVSERSGGTIVAIEARRLRTVRAEPHAERIHQRELTLAARIAERHHGTLRVDEGPGPQRWQLVLPARRAPAVIEAGDCTADRSGAEHGDGRLRPAPTATARILIVEEHGPLRSLLARILADEHDVIAVGTAEEALDAMAGHRPDVLVCELTGHLDAIAAPTGGLQGDTAAGIAVLLVERGSGTGQQRRPQRPQLEPNTTDVIMAPFTPEQLRARVRTLLATRTAVEDLRRRASQAQQLADQLQGALDSRVIVEQAKGVLAGELGVPVEEAFAMLRSYARNHNHKLHDVAAAVVHGGFRF